MPDLITYPLRPINGGKPLPDCWDMMYGSRHRSSRYVYQAKLNGWRAVIHVPSLTVWNRHGGHSTVADQFRPALDQLHRQPFEWLDVELMLRRTVYRAGSIVILDGISDGLHQHERRRHLADTFPTFDDTTASSEVYLVPERRISDKTEAESYWQELLTANESLPGEVYEGCVAKRSDSHYPLQLAQPGRTTADWIKHRWDY